MLQIRLNRGSSQDGSAGAQSSPPETVTVACPDHLVLADLQVAKGLGSATAGSAVKILGRRSRRQLSERVHFCVRCDFPIAIYGRLIPCEHIFCLDCARSDSICYLCGERIQKIQTIKMMEGVFVCAAPGCLKSFLKKTEFVSHIYDTHAPLLQPNMKREEMNEPQISVSKQSSTLDTSARGPPRQNFPQSDLDDNKGHHQQPPPRATVMQPNNRPMGIDTFCPPNFPMPMNSNHAFLGPPPFGFPPFPSDGGPNFYGAPVSYEVARSESTQEGGQEQGLASGVASSFQGPWSGAHSEPFQGGQGLLATPQGMSGPPPPPPGPPPPHLLQQKHGYFPSGDGKNFG